jgi:hypothetical protein
VRKSLHRLLKTFDKRLATDCRPKIKGTLPFSEGSKKGKRPLFPQNWATWEWLAGQAGVLVKGLAFWGGITSSVGALEVANLNFFGRESKGN